MQPKPLQDCTARRINRRRSSLLLTVVARTVQAAVSQPRLPQRAVAIRQTCLIWTNYATRDHNNQEPQLQSSRICRAPTATRRAVAAVAVTSRLAIQTFRLHDAGRLTKPARVESILVHVISIGVCSYSACPAARDWI